MHANHPRALIFKGKMKLHWRQPGTHWAMCKKLRQIIDAALDVAITPLLLAQAPWLGPLRSGRLLTAPCLWLLRSAPWRLALKIACEGRRLSERAPQMPDARTQICPQ